MLSRVWTTSHTRIPVRTLVPIRKVATSTSYTSRPTILDPRRSCSNVTSLSRNETYVKTHGQHRKSSSTIDSGHVDTEPVGDVFAQFEPGCVIGPPNRYVVQRQLGSGVYANFWLAADMLATTAGDKYIAVKVLTTRATDLINQGRLHELHCLQKISVSGNPSKHCLRLKSHFTLPRTSSGAEHLCLVTDIIDGDVHEIQKSFGGRCPLPLVKRVVHDVLHGLAHAHSLGVVHADVKGNNIFFKSTAPPRGFESSIESHPFHRDRLEDVAVSPGAVHGNEPLPLPSIEDLSKLTFVLGDFGSARPTSECNDADISTPFSLRPPEMVLSGPWNEKLDIWAVGCLIFELLCGRHLFNYEPYPKYSLESDQHYLYQMMCYGGEGFSQDLLNKTFLGPIFFDEQGQLREHPPLFSRPFDACLRAYDVLEEEDVLQTAAIMQRCLHLDPEERPSAAELMEDPWFYGVE